MQFVEMKKPLINRRHNQSSLTSTAPTSLQGMNEPPPAGSERRYEEEREKSDKHPSGSHDVPAAGGAEGSLAIIPPTNIAAAVTSTAASVTTVETGLASKVGQMRISSPPQSQVTLWIHLCHSLQCIALYVFYACHIRNQPSRECIN